MLFLQELVEGSLFQVLVTAALARSGGLLFAAYQISLQLTGVFLAPMFMYCHALMVLLGEKIGEKDQQKMRQLPIITLQIVLFFYTIMAIIGWLFRGSLMGALTDLPDVLAQGISIFWLVILTEASRPFYEITKYSLQTIGGEKPALLITGMINCGAIVAIWILPNQLGVILFLVTASNLLCACSFYFVFRKICEAQVFTKN